MEIWTGTDLEAEEVIQKLYNNEYEKLVRNAVSYLRTRSSKPHMAGRAEDVVQETFALLWERRKEVLSREKPEMWLYKALQYKSKELLREENKWVKLLLRYEQFYIPPTEIDGNFEWNLESFVPKEDYDLLYKFYVAGYSYQELCKETGLSKTALGVRIHRIKKKIREKLGK